MLNHLSHISTKNYWNVTTIVEIIVDGWVVSVFETQCNECISTAMRLVLVFNIYHLPMVF